MMNYNSFQFDTSHTHAEVTRFCPSEGAVSEWHVMLHVDPLGDSFSAQWSRICQAEAALMKLPFMRGAQCVMRRYFLSDSANQYPLMQLGHRTEAVSVIQQQPLDGSKVALWLYLQDQTTITHQGSTTLVSHQGYTHLWDMGLYQSEGSSAEQTATVLQRYEDTLQQHGATLAENCIRTWFFVRDVDTQYAGLVTARRTFFTRHGLTAQTHYIASTGIGGSPADPHAIIQLGCYALKGFEPSQQRYLYARTHLNPTYEYGVTFERGVALDFGDRRHVYISGTASINNQGQVVHEGDVVRQTHRMWENVETLLAEANVSYDDVAQLIVYLRDMADYPVIRRLFAERFPHIPTVITLAPVCRPAWLIEMECIAIKAISGNAYRPF